ncbi:MAG: ABC transporter substrate-binding protein [Myxococcales bacterium]|nr:ABC transporter substrate-binding protein [Myxococcales bacterium]
MHRFIASLAMGCLLAVAASPASAQTFRYPEDARPSSLLPFFAEDMSAVRMVELIFDGLVLQNKRGDIEGSLATSWKRDPDNMGITFVLREGVKWHDGQPFTADDVVFTVKAAQDKKTVFNAKSKYRFIRDVQASGQFQVHFSFDRPIAEPEERFTFKIMPKHAFTSTTITRKDRFGRKPIGTGPYQVSKFSLRSVTLEVNGSHWRQPRVGQVLMQHTPDKSAQINLLQYSGGKAGVQAVIFVPPKNIAIFENSDSVVLEPYHTVSWWYMAYNHESGALKDPVVREAIALAINREELLEAHLGRGDILGGPFTESSPFYNFEVTPREPDVERAAQMLEDAGYKMKGDSRKKGRNKLDFKFVLDKELTSNQPLFLGIQAQLKKIGVIVRPQYVDHARYREQVFTSKKFDLTLNVWSFKDVEDVYPLFHSQGVMNFIGYNNAQVDTLLDTAKATRDYKQYKEYMKKLHAELNRDLPYFFLWSLDIYSGISKRVRNVMVSPYSYFTFFPGWELMQ